MAFPSVSVHATRDVYVVLTQHDHNYKRTNTIAAQIRKYAVFPYVLATFRGATPRALERVAYAHRCDGLDPLRMLARTNFPPIAVTKVSYLFDWPFASSATVDCKKSAPALL